MGLGMVKGVREEYAKRGQFIDVGIAEENMVAMSSGVAKKKSHQLVITIEDGEVTSGYGQNIASFYGNSNMKVLDYGISKAFHTDFNPDELLKENGISVENISNVIEKFIKN